MKFKLFDTVATVKSIPSERLTLVEPEYASISHLPLGQIGTIVECYETSEQTRYLIEFADSQGREYAMSVLDADEILAIH